MSLDISYSGGVFSAPQAKSVGTVTAGTETYDIANASYDSVSFSFVTEGDPHALQFKPDGTKLYIVGTVGDAVDEYDLSTAWDITTASYNSVTFSVSSQESAPCGMFFKPDGTKMYIYGQFYEYVFQYALSTAWDLSTASYESKSLNTSSQASNGTGVFFKSDGTSLYVCCKSTDAVYQYDMTTAWDVSTGSYSNNSLSVSSQESNPEDIYFKPDGTKMYLVGTTSDKVHQYSLSTAWDLSTASYDNIYFSNANEAGNVRGITFKSDGTKMYLIDLINDTIYQYSTGTATTLDLSTGNYFSHTPSVNTTFAFSNAPASGTAAGFALALTGANVAETYDLANASYDSKSFSVASQETFPSSLVFKPDGTKMFVVGYGNDAILQYSLSTAWDVSTASYDSVSFSVSSQEPNSQGLFIKPDGTKFWITGNSDKVWQYSMSTAWDISTASYDSVNFSTFSQATLPVGVEFKSDGTKMYIIDVLGTQRVYQYSLSTAWDLSTTSYDSVSFITSSQDATPLDLTFNSDGTKMYMIGSTTDTIYQYGLSTAWDLSTASYDNVSFSVASQETSPRDVFFKPDGTKFYIVGDVNDTVYQYTSTSTSAATFTYPSSVKFPSGIAPAGPAIDETDVLVFYTDDGGTTYQGFRAGNAMS